jgi:hypothetical protein
MTEPKKLESYVREMLDHGTSEDEPIDSRLMARHQPVSLNSGAAFSIAVASFVASTAPSQTAVLASL